MCPKIWCGRYCRKIFWELNRAKQLNHSHMRQSRKNMTASPAASMIWLIWLGFQVLAFMRSFLQSVHHSSVLLASLHSSQLPAVEAKNENAREAWSESAASPGQVELRTGDRRLIPSARCCCRVRLRRPSKNCRWLQGAFRSGGEPRLGKGGEPSERV